MNGVKKLAYGIVLSAAVALAGTAQAFVSPGITINGTKPTKDGTYSGYTYQDGVFRLTSAGKTYTFAGQDASGNVRIEAAANCTIRLSDGFDLDLSSRPNIIGETRAQRSPISLSGNVSVTVQADGEAKLRGGDMGAGVRVVEGQTVYLTSTGSGILRAYGGSHGAGIGTGYEDSPCGTIYVRGRVFADGGGQACGVGQGNSGVIGHPSSGGTIIVDDASADLKALGSYPAAAIGTSSDSTGTMNITILDGKVRAEQYSGYGAAIGTGYSASGTCNITILGGTVEAIAFQNPKYESGAGIGAGYWSTATMKITIAGECKVTAKGGSGSAGIGGG